MYKIIIACDKFKGSLSALEACTWIKKGISSTAPINTTCDIHPMADGGEGTMAILTDHLGLEAVSVLVRDPLGRMITASYGVNGPEAFIETSVSCGQQLLQPYEQNPMNANTYGVGQMICDAIDRGCKTIHLFVGGSATTDGGAGMAAALGYVFKDEKGDAFVPIGKTLSNIKTIQGGGAEAFSGVLFHVWTDVAVPLFGPTGSAYMFAKQKGANPEEVALLDFGLRNLHNTYQMVTTKQNIADISGSGAAGGLAAGCVAFLGAQIGSGIDFLIDKTKLEAKVIEADLVITGEGSIDNQSVEGKVVSGVANLCRKYNKKLILVGGRQSISVVNLGKLGPTDIYTIMHKKVTLDDAIALAGAKLKDIGNEIGRKL